MAILQPKKENISTNNPQPIVGQVVINSQKEKNTTFYSSKILNYIESIEIDGILKTVFYTEVNTNVNIGDRVFILNGNYDTQKNIFQSKYKKFTDGYRVLDVSGCRVVLDINFTNLKPQDELNTDNFIFLRHIENQKDFDYINSLKVCVGENKFVNPYSGYIDSDYLKLNTQNFIYTSEAFLGSGNEDYKNSGVDASGFWCRIDNQTDNYWINVTDYFKNGKILGNPDFTKTQNIFIIGEDFELPEINLKLIERNVYKFEDFKWKPNTLFYQPFMSKSIFRKGTFNGGFSDGIYGTYEERAVWDGGTWYGGVMVNTEWRSGFMDSKHTTGEKSYTCKIQTVGTVSRPVQYLDDTNNRGFGYNFIEDSDFLNYTIMNGNFKNCNFTFSTSKYALDIYYGLTSSDFQNVITGGKFELCDITSIQTNGGYFLNSLITNSNLKNSKLVSSETVDCTLDSGYWSSDGGVKILGAELQSLDLNPGTLPESELSKITGTLKLYISDEDYFKLNLGDTFYISLQNKDTINNLLTDSQRILHNIESKFMIDNFDDYELVQGVKNNIKVSLKSRGDNNWKFTTNISEPIIKFTEQIDSENSEYWYTIPFEKWKGLFNSSVNSNLDYQYGDIVYSGSDFYQFVPFLRQFAPLIVNRTSSQEEVDTIWADGYVDDTGTFVPFNYTPTGLSVDPILGISDWIYVGLYDGKWSADGSYNGYLYPEESSPYQPSFASGSVVSDNDSILNSENFYIFIGNSIEEIVTNKSVSIPSSTPGVLTNYFTTSNVDLPSIDISTEVFGWFFDKQSKFTPTSKFAIAPIDTTNVNNLFVDTVLKNGNFRNGLINNSTWISGDNINYQNNLLKRKDGTFSFDCNLNTYDNQPSLLFNLNGRIYSTEKSFAGYDFRVGDYVWLKSFDYIVDGTSTNLDGRYQVVRYLSNSNQLEIVSVDGSNNLSDLTPGGNFVTLNASSNTYYSIHKLNISNSKIESGKFRRTGFDNCIFENKLFKKYVYPLSDLKNAQILRLVNTLFDRTNNEVKSGMVFYSHFVNDIFNGGTFYDSIWLGGTFSDGLFKYSVWTDGNFNGGKFVDSRESTIYRFDFDTFEYNKLWQGGNFNGGEFFNSIWVKGTFNNGRFYKSDWTGGIWNGGVLGSKDLRTMDTTLAYYGPTTSFGVTYTVWNNGFVENAMVGGVGALDWFGGKFSGGEFTSFDRTEQSHSIWYDGEFYSGKFTKNAWWLDGTFNGGKFLSEIGWNKSNFFTYSNDIIDYGWVDGEFNGGEFGNANTSTNSVWYNGLMQGGIFQGRFWRDGVALNGKIYGSLELNPKIHRSLFSFTQSFYGLWNDGFVTNRIYDPKSDLIVTTNYNFISSNQVGKKLNEVDIEGVLWKNGTFSHELSNFNNSVWLGGEFNSGNFNNSHFNPFVDLELKGLDPENLQYGKYYDYLITQLESIFDDYTIVSTETYLSGKKLKYVSQSNSAIISKVVNLASSFTLLNLKIEAQLFDGFVGSYNGDTLEENNYQIISENAQSGSYDQYGTSTIIKIYDEFLLSGNPSEYVALIFEVNTISEETGLQGFDLKYYYLNKGVVDTFDFNRLDTCVWTGGNFNSGEFNFSKWLGGNFNDGLMLGGIWKDGVFNYGTMSNSYWENGTWRNGTWDGSPFNYESLDLNGTYLDVTNNKQKFLILNIADYSDNYKIHLNNFFTKEKLTSETTVHSFNPGNGFISWTYSKND